MKGRWLFQQFHHLGRHFGITAVGVVHIADGGKQVHPGIAVLNIAVQMQQAFRQFLQFQSCHILQFGLGNIAPFVQQLPDAQGSLLPGDEIRAVPLCRCASRKADTRSVVPDSILLVTDVKARAVGLIVIPKENGVFRGGLVLHEIRRDVFPAVPIIRANGQGSVNDLLRIL